MKYTQKYRIYENDVDFRKMATLGTLLRYCQQIGAEDAEHYGITPELYASTHTSYVLAKLALHITRTPRVEETITVQTEPEALHRAVNRRFTTFCDAQGREEACVDSRWVLIDTDKRMILRKHPEGFPTTGWVDKLERELPIKLTKVKREDCEELGTHRAVYSRCDRNGHMNNTVYADLICDAGSMADPHCNGCDPVLSQGSTHGRKHPPVPRRSGRKPLVYGRVAGGYLQL